MQVQNNNIIMEEELIDVDVEEEIKEVKTTLDSHGSRIGKLEIDSEVMKERWGNITSQLTRIENSSLTSNNALLASNNAVLSTLNKVIEGNTTQSSNKKDIIMKVLTIGGSILGLLVLGYFAAKGINLSIPMF